MDRDPFLSRRRFIGKLGAVTGAMALGGAGAAEAFTATSTGGRAPAPKTPAEALRILQAGNKRYRHEKLTLRDYSPVGERRASEQKPFAAIITCSDSRISPELVFDVERGNIFVSRVAGNGIDNGTLGSTEYAIAVLGVKLVLVLGHSDCGAIKSAIATVAEGKTYPSSKYGAIGDVIEPLLPTVESLPADERTLARCVPANAIAQAQDIARRGPIVAPAIQSGAIDVVAGVYNIANGAVSIFRLPA
ncbi:MAG: twin-arginine translocation signal domain-containing protein [Actinobacteria bacterium]|nr:twin-arginine translocation signal domain-containing protein [Actinomycetota bacterium]